MTGSTHYIEQFKDTVKGLYYAAPVIEINNLTSFLKNTSYPLKTIAVWKIKFKPGYEPVKPESL